MLETGYYPHTTSVASIFSPLAILDPVGDLQWRARYLALFHKCNSFRSHLKLSTSNKVKLDPYFPQQCGPNNLWHYVTDLP